MTLPIVFFRVCSDSIEKSVLDNPGRTAGMKNAGSWKSQKWSRCRPSKKVTKQPGNPGSFLVCFMRHQSLSIPGGKVIQWQLLSTLCTLANLDMLKILKNDPNIAAIG
jgi:hypothetical protein